VVFVIVAVIMALGYLAGIVVGLVLAAVLFAFTYGRVDLIHEVSFGDVYRSTVDRPPAEREALAAMGDRVQILRVRGFVFFGSTPRLLGRIRDRFGSGSPPGLLVLDVGRVTGMDASAVAAFSKALRLARSQGAEVIVTGASSPVRAQLERGGVAEGTAGLRFEPDLDHGLERCEEAVLEAEAFARAREATTEGGDGLPASLAPHLERVAVREGDVVLRQDAPPGDLFVLTEGRLAVETVTAEGKRVRLRVLRPGAVVGELAFYTGAPRTADVVAERSSIVLRCSADRIARIEAEPAAAIELHRWLATAIAGRLSGSTEALDALLD
jgi:SulP family sulfate permease